MYNLKMELLSVGLKICLLSHLLHQGNCVVLEERIENRLNYGVTLIPRWELQPTPDYWAHIFKVVLPKDDIIPNIPNGAFPQFSTKCQERLDVPLSDIKPENHGKSLFYMFYRYQVRWQYLYTASAP